MQECIESIGELVVASCQAPKLFEAIEELLNEIACLVSMPVDAALGIAIAARWDDGLGPGALDDGHQGIAVIALIGDHGPGRDRLDQGSALSHIGHLASCQNQANRIAERIDAGVDLRCQSAPRAADRLIATVFLGAPAECW